MKKKATGSRILLGLALFCITLLAFCSVSFAEQLDPRWKWSKILDHIYWYYDTKTIEYNPKTQSAKFWVLALSTNGRLRTLSHHSICFKDKTWTILESIDYSGNVPKHRKKEYLLPAKQIVRPDTAIEALARNAASQLGIAPLYKGGPDRWKWIHSTDTYSMYIAKDTLLYHPDTKKYSVWTKKSYFGNREYYLLYYLSFTDETVKSPGSDDYMPPMPGRIEEYVLNAAEKLR